MCTQRYACIFAGGNQCPSFGRFSLLSCFSPTSRAYSDYPPALIASAKNGRKGGEKREFAQKPHTHSHIKWQKIWNFLLLLVLCLSLHRKLDCLSLLNILKLGGGGGEGFFYFLVFQSDGRPFSHISRTEKLAECAEMYFSHKNKKKKASRTCHSIIHHPSFLFHFHFFPFAGGRGTVLEYVGSDKHTSRVSSRRRRRRRRRRPGETAVAGKKRYSS